MRIFLYELKRRRLGLALWAAGLVALIAISMAKFSTLTSGTGTQDISVLLEQFPRTLQAMFGMTGLDITTLSGYFGILFLYIAIGLAVHAGLLGVNLLADEEQDKTTEFLYIKPISRARIITAKLAAGVCNLLALWLVTAAGAWLAVFSTGASRVGFFEPFIVFMLAALVIQLVFFSLGFMLIGIFKDSRLPGRIIAAVVFVEYLIYVFSKLTEQLDWLRYLTIFRSYDAVWLLEYQRLPLIDVAICGGVVLVALIVGYWRYSRRDLQV